MNKNPDAVRFALQQVKEGNIFENFAQEFLASKLGYNFIPAGGIRDRGIDGLEHIFHREGYEKIIYQISIDKEPVTKLEDTLKKLQANKISYSQLIFVSNQVIKDKDILADKCFENYRIHVRIWDIDWFAANINHSHGTISAFHIFVESHLHEYNKPGTAIKVSDLLTDPRLFVFLRQQWEAHHAQKSLVDLVTDSLIFYGLEGTDPEKEKLRSKGELIDQIHEKLKFIPKVMSSNLDHRLDYLSKKPQRKINHHTKDDKYCLPFETRQELIDKNLQDAGLHDDFKKTSSEKLNYYLKSEEVQVRETYPLIESTLNKIFYKQGLEFADLVNSKDYKDSFSKSLPDIIAEVVNESSVVEKNRPVVRDALLVTIRDLIYNGTSAQKKFLKRLSNTYMLLFTLQCDPKVATYFETMAHRLNLYVGNSILIPALSETFLEPQNRRYWSLFNASRRAGIKLYINDTIVDELVAHIKRIKGIYENEFSGTEDIYNHEAAIASIPEILLRAYFYSHMREKVKNFDEYIDRFCNISFVNLKQDLIDFLKEEFNIKYEANVPTGATINQEEHQKLTNALSKLKTDNIKAKNDATLILTIYAIRKVKNEMADAGIYGFNTWWLSTDITTRKVVSQIFKDKYPLSCYMRPDFLYNYISLSPSINSVDDVYKELFPGLLGVNISHTIPPEISNLIKENVRKYKDKNRSRLKSAVREMADELKTNPGSFNVAKMKSFFEKKLS